MLRLPSGASPIFFQPAIIVENENAFGSQPIRAHVVEIIEEGEITLGENPQPYQVLRVELLEGEYKGLPMEVDYGKRQLRNDTNRNVPGDEIFVQIGKNLNNVLTAHYGLCAYKFASDSARRIRVGDPSAGALERS